MIRINAALSIPASELRFTFTTSRGPGGQNVNKVATRAILAFDVAASQSLSDAQRAVILNELRSRLTSQGVLLISSGRERTQEANRKHAIDTLRKVLAHALRPRRLRRATKPTKASVQRRLTAKAARSRTKQERRRPADD